ncbi:S-layer homology domain-containing protein [Paenibacillus sedimenti]|uniref:S-layer homology domain-containing protein n=1 Tax=Paenibacillus sedimenti TaxID=2770274 RepID=A0A926KKS7_9BACL|nr:S-layer homology domain-containing protein [Paenibacillus sedimenti]MBD0378811.1 S-layer homology domain-containing protein [Paenibacillus sedimenti]
MRRKHLSVSLALLLFILLLPVTALAADTASYSLTISNDKPEGGQEVQVTVKGHNLKDLYAYEVNFVYDAGRLRFKQAKSEIPGFTVPALVKEDRIQFAGTKIGDDPGVNGDATLCIITFEAIGKGKAKVELTDVKLVNSQLASTTQKAGMQIATDIQNGKLVAFRDIAGHWAREAIEKAVKLGFVNGYEDDTFRPQGLITRAEFTVMLARALQLPDNGDKKQSFADLERIPEWARSSISAAMAAGIVDGYDDNTFRSDNRITRAEMTAMVARAVKLNVDTAAVSTFADADHIPDWAYPIVTAAHKAGLIQGRDGNLFVPADHATRAEAVTLILSVMTYKK